METVIRLFAEARQGPFEICAFECLDKASYLRSTAHLGIAPPVEPSTETYVLLEAEGASDADFEAWIAAQFESGAASSGTLALNQAQGRDLWRIRESVAESILAGGVVHQHDVSVPVARLPEFSQAIVRKYAEDYPELDVYVFGHIGDGNLHVFLRKPEDQDKAAFLKRCKDSDEELFRFVRDFQGSVSAEHGIGRLKKAALPYCRSPEEIEILRGIKRAFDPANLLNPGKIL
jgi:FAD/FMN-containing dehydrogenase